MNKDLDKKIDILLSYTNDLVYKVNLKETLENINKMSYSILQSFKDKPATEVKELKDELLLVEIFTDGALSKSDVKSSTGRGGYGGVIVIHEKEKEYYGYVENTTSQRMELTAFIKGVEHMRTLKCNIIVYTDSQYLQQGFSSWMENWKKNNWIKSDKKPVLNQDLWEQIYDLKTYKNIEVKWIKAHTGKQDRESIYNSKADKLATTAVKTYGE